ncbi:MAG: hypothetical protein QM676_00330 [Novosphingobium sp.]
MAYMAGGRTWGFLIPIGCIAYGIYLRNDAALTVKTLLQIVGVLLAIPVAIMAIWLAIFAVGFHFETERKIIAAVQSGFPGAEITINDRKDVDEAYQICFDVTARPKSGGPARRAIVMVGSWDGSSSLRPNRYRSMQDCEKGVSRG